MERSENLASLISWEVRTETSGEGPTTFLPHVLQECENAGFVGLSWHLCVSNLLFLCFPSVQKKFWLGIGIKFLIYEHSLISQKV